MGLFPEDLAIENSVDDYYLGLAISYVRHCISHLFLLVRLKSL